VTGPLMIAISVVSLLVAVWCLVAAARDVAPDRSQFVGIGIVGLLVLAQAVVALSEWAGGTRPADRATFVGYLLTALLLPPAGAVLARMEPTRWGSVILGAVGLVIPVLVLRLNQVWG
jgi:hypothetical protein